LLTVGSADKRQHTPALPSWQNVVLSHFNNPPAVSCDLSENSCLAVGPVRDEHHLGDGTEQRVRDGDEGEEGGIEGEG
jgi:hypothetical protein